MITRGRAGIFKPKTYLTQTENNHQNSIPKDMPKNISEAMENGYLREAMQSEFDALIKNKTWILVLSEPQNKVVGFKWVFKIKYNTDGSVSKFKARLVAKGFHQILAVNFFET